jgi:hypothetical protein
MLEKRPPPLGKLLSQNMRSTNSDSSTLCRIHSRSSQPPAEAHTRYPDHKNAVGEKDSRKIIPLSKLKLPCRLVSKSFAHKAKCTQYEELIAVWSRCAGTSRSGIAFSRLSLTNLESPYHSSILLISHHKNSIPDHTEQPKSFRVYSS